MKKKQEVSTLVKVLEWVCGFALGIALISTTWAWFAYRARNGSFFPKLNSGASSPSYTFSDSLFPASTPIPDGSKLQMDPNAIKKTSTSQETQGEVMKNVSIIGFKTLSINADTTSVSVDFYNPSSNEGEYLMTFEFFLASEDGSLESVYSSGLVEAGNHIRNITLSHPIPKGTYDNCILRIQPYFVSDKSPASTSEIVFTLFAE